MDTGEPNYTKERRTLIDKIRREQPISKNVLDAMRTVPRHLFVKHNLWTNSYSDIPLAIGSGQTISQPSLVALMSDLLQLN